MTDRDSSTHAERLRQRRKQEEARRPKRVPKRTSLPAPTLPRRGVTLDASTQRARPQAKSNRRYETLAAAPVAGQLSLPRSPSLPRVRAGWRLLSFLLLAVFGAGIYFAWTLPMFHVAGITLLGNQILRAEEVESALKLNGSHIILVIPSEAENVLRHNFPETTSVKVTVELPNKVIISVTERQPIIRWEQDGVYTWVDAQGVAFRPRGEMAGLVVVHASGKAPSNPTSESDPLVPIPFVEPQIIESIRLLAPQLPQGSVLLYDPKHGLGWADRRGWTVWFGTTAEQTEMKLRVYSALVSSLVQRGITPTFINVAHPGAPYYRVGH